MKLKKKEPYYKALFLIAAIYDTLLGFIFLFFYKIIYEILNIPLPQYPSYISLSAAFVFVIGLGYYLVYRNLYANRDLVKIGAIYKLAYFLVVTYYFFFGILPHILFLVFGIIDFIFLILFLEFLSSTKNKSF